MSGEVRFFVPGIPQPGGSKKGIPFKTKAGAWRAAVVEDAAQNAPWRAKVSLFASQSFPAPLTGPIEFSFHFVMPRPKHHYRTGKWSALLKPDAPTAHTIKPDATKLIRSTEDALKGIAWHDDCQVVMQSASKLYGATPGCWVTIRPFVEGNSPPKELPRREDTPAPMRSLFD